MAVFPGGWALPGTEGKEKCASVLQPSWTGRQWRPFSKGQRAGEKVDKDERQTKK